ncbi:MAG: transcription antitermination factor NusB, partial [Verrucomicrobiota bacterium]
MSQPPRNKRRKGREAALQLLYASDLEGELRDGQHRDAFWDLCQVKPSGKEFAETLVQGVLDHLIEIDTRIERTLHNYE